MRKRKLNNHLAEGEHTGNFHLAKGNGVEVFGDQDDDGLASLMVAPNGALIEHQEHKTTKIKRSDVAELGAEFDISAVVEFDPLDEEIRRVQD
jgi:hypothetical protein